MPLVIEDALELSQLDARQSQPAFSKRHAEHRNGKRGGTSDDERNHDPVTSPRPLFAGGRRAHFVTHGNCNALGRWRSSCSLVVGAEGGSRRVGISDFVTRAPFVDSAAQDGCIGPPPDAFPVSLESAHPTRAVDLLRVQC